MGEGATGMSPIGTENGKVPAPSPRETTRQLDGEIAALREELAGLVAELDRRRHELLDIKLQAKRHVLEMALTGAALVATAAGFVWLGAWRSRRRQSMRSRAGRLREAFSRMLAKPERVAAEPTVPTKIFTAAANAAVATAIKKVVERGLQGALKRKAETRPPQLRPFPSRAPARLEAVPDSGNESPSRH
jgi:hypothetical protein